MIWRDAEMEFGTFGEKRGEAPPCVVRIDGAEIVVEYSDGRGVVAYRGRDLGGGHFTLKCPQRSGTATLHTVPGIDRLEGFWSEESWQGWWFIALGKASQVPEQGA